MGVGDLAETSTTEQIERFIEQTAKNRVKSFPAWPTNIFQLELEEAGIYQNKSGSYLAKMISNGELAEDHVDGIPYIHDPSTEMNLQGTRVKDATDIFYEYRDNHSQAAYPELTLYVALSKERSLLNGDIMEVYPKGNYKHILRGMPDEIDGLLKLNNEWFALQVYSGIQLLTMESESGKRGKIQQAEKVSNNKTPKTNPVIISHLASENVRNHMREPHDGTVLDTQKLIACRSNHSQLESALKFLNIRDRVEFMPRLSTCYDKLELDGKRYNELADEVPTAITPDKVAPGATDLPDRYRQLVRGMLHLLYVNTFWRQADGRTEREASFLLQEAFHHLLRKDGMEIENYIDIGWEELEDRLRNIKAAKQREPMIRDKAQEYISTLVDQNVMRQRGNTIYARNSLHPHTSLSFPTGF
jgi:hypothetical protein